MQGNNWSAEKPRCFELYDTSGTEAVVEPAKHTEIEALVLKHADWLGCLIDNLLDKALQAHQYRIFLKSLENLGFSADLSWAWT